MMTITMGKSPDVTLHKRTIKLKAQQDQQPPSLLNSGKSAEKVYHQQSKQQNMKNSLGVSNSAKVIETSKSNKLEGVGSAASKKSIELSDSCP